MPTLKYAELYDEFRNTDGVKQAQTAVWKRFVPFEEPGPLSLADWRELHAAIDDARGLDFAMARELGIFAQAWRCSRHQARDAARRGRRRPSDLQVRHLQADPEELTAKQSRMSVRRGRVACR
jgi:hypothetical protein